MLKIKYIVDSTSDIPRDFAEKNDITVLGMPIIFEDGSTVRDWVEISPDEFYARLTAADKIPTTSQVPYAEIEEAMLKGLEDHDAVIFFPLSSKGSGTCQSALLAKQTILEKMPDAKIEVVDTMAYSLFIPLMVEEAIRLQKEGKTLEEIVEGAKLRRCYTDVTVVVDTLKYLEKGGRINKASLIAGTLLDIKPVLSVRGGIMESIDKFRGSKTIISKMIKKMKASGLDTTNPDFCIVHSNADEKANQLWDAIKAEFPNAELHMTSQLGATVGTHIGPGTVAVLYRLNEPAQVYED